MSPTAPRARAAGTRAGPLLFAAALAGAATMTVELSAVRFLAPWYGASAPVWTNVIGVILLGLAVGYLVGAALARGGDLAARLRLLLALAALWCAALPRIVGPVAGWFLPERIALDQSADLVFWGSLAATVSVFAAPAVFLGAVGPLWIELLEAGQRLSGGAAGGRVLAASTLGSLAGTFGTTHVFVPLLGLAWTARVAALVLLAALVVLGWPRRRGTLALELFALAAVAWPPARLAPAPPEGRVLLEARESPYQSVRVVEEERDGRLLRQLQVNEGFDSFQSVWTPQPGFFGEGYYYDLFALPLWWDRDHESWRVLVVGLGAGSALRVLTGAAPPADRLRSTGIEIDPVVVALGRRYCDLPAPGDPDARVVSGLDGRTALRALEPESFDLAIVDAYSNQVEIPPHLASVEFFRELAARLAPGGWIAVNVGGFDFTDPVVGAVGASLSSALRKRVLALRVPRARNYVLIGRKEGEPPPPPWTFEGGPRAGAATAMAAPLELPGAWRYLVPSDGQVLSDDRAPLARLAQQSIRGARRQRRAVRP